MAGEEQAITLEELLAQAGWLRALALRLAGDADVADDALQETWMAAMQHAPAQGEWLRPWLAKVLRNALRMRARSEGRRAVRENQAVDLRDEIPTPESLVAKAEGQRLLAGLVLRLEEPYRSTVLLHFGEGLTLADIARGQGISAGTARWRLKVALDQLRDWLDAESGGRRRWALLPLMAVPKGVLVAKKSTSLVVVILVLLGLLVTGGLLVTRQRGEASGADSEKARRRPGAMQAQRAGAGALDAEQRGWPAWLSQPDVAPRRIAGRVRFQGQPVSGATVELASLASESGAVTAPRRSTDASGRFDFGLQPAMEWSVRATAPGKTGASVYVDARNPVRSPPPDDLVLELGACDAAMVGTVRDASGGALAGARLSRLEMAGVSAIPGGVAVETDGSGRYELCVERSWPGSVVVEVSADGYGAIVFSGLVLGRVKVDFALVPEAVIVGRVVRDDTGEPVPEAHVFLPQGPPSLESHSWRGAFTGADGRFRIARVAPGRHVVRARAEGMVSSPRGIAVVVEAGQTTEEIEIRLEPGAVVRGVVLAGDEPVAGARVGAVAADGIRSARTAVSQTDGTFTLEEVPRGEVQFRAWPYEVVAPDSLWVERSEHAGVVLEVEALGAIVGRVVHGQRPVPGADIQIHGPNARELAAVRADGEGRFEARGLQPGPWILFGESPRLGRFGRAPETIALERGETEEVTIDLAYGASIEGVVVDQDGAPVAGVAVTFQHTTMDDAGIAVTSEDGSFRAATMMGGGAYRTIVRPYQTSAAALRPASGRAFPLITLADADAEVTGVVLAVQLDRLSIAGRVVDSSKGPVPDARVTAALIQGDQQPRFLRWVHHAAATTDVAGAFSIDDLSEGTYALEVRAASGAETTVAGIRAGRTDIVLTLPSAGAIEGALLGFTGAPEVTASRIDGAGAAAPTHGRVAGTSFTIPELSPGVYFVVARTPTESATARVDVSAGATSQVTLSSGGSGTIVGRVVDFRSGKPVQGMTCRALPRVGTEAMGGAAGDGTRTDAQGAFVIADAPAGDLAVSCTGLWRAYSDGLRLIALPPSRRLEISVPVVGWQEDIAAALASFGAEIDRQALVPFLIQVAPKGPAAAAGFRNGDRVVAVDGASVTELSPSGVWMLITNRPPGTTVELTAERGGHRHSGDLLLGDYEAP